MTAQEFIESRLNELKPAKKTIPKEELADFIFKTLMSKKFRKFSVAPSYISHIHKAIESNVKNNLPIKLVLPFGGYKLWRLEETPEADWAELFALMYFAKWIKPITDVYEPGVIFDFSSDEIIVERMNNIPTSDTESYAKTFNMVTKFLKNYLPSNIKFSVTPVRSHYTPEEFEKDLKEQTLVFEKKFGGLPQLDKRRRNMVELNVRLKPEQEEDEFWREKTELMHQAYMAVPKRRAHNRAEDAIRVFPTKIEDCIPIGSTKTSVAKFWPAAGALKKTEEGYAEYVLSPSQIETTKFKKEDITIPGLDSKNFKKIKIFS